MKAVVLGGAGIMGSYAVEVLARKAFFSELVVADINEERGKEIAAKNDAKFQKVDVSNAQNLASCIKDADVVINCVGPFYKFAPLVLKAAIEEGVNYVDICDDYDVTHELIEKFNEEAMKKGVTCIIGLGASPGITNVIASYAAEMLDEIEEIKVYVTRGIKEEAGEAIPYHMLHCWLGEIPVYENGKYKKARGLRDGKECVRFPEPFGEAFVYYFGHPETVTLPKYIEEVKNVCCKGTFFPPMFREILLNLEQLGLLSNELLNVKGYTLTPIDFLASYISSTVQKMSNMPDVPEGGAVMVEVKGKKNGKARIYKFSGIARMKEATATPAAIAAIMIAKNEIKSPGVKAPEACVPAKEFLNMLMTEGIFGKTWMAEEKEMEELP
ncbi:MAG: hypothetical protein DRN29_08820 [Thermoplasmata archaeon]|nr:MAG: hypothetical protein DRN29_08820 [Thermoplasmata archaeon]